MTGLSIQDTLYQLWNSTGFLAMTGRDVIMIGIACLLLYLAIVKKYEPLLLLPIAFGMLLVNLPLTGLTASPIHHLDGTVSSGGILYYIYQGIKIGLYPPLIFLGIGAMTDFSPLIANPKTLLLGAAAQLGIFITFIGALYLGFSPQEAGAISIIGGADGPTSILLASILAPHLLGAIAIAAYSYMALVPIIQPPIMKALTTEKSRQVVMEQLREVSKVEKILFPIVVTILCILLLPSAAPLIGMLMFGNLLRESGVADRLSDTAQNAMINTITIFLGLAVGSTASAEAFLSITTIKIIIMGLLAFSVGTAGGVMFGNVMYWLTKGKVNPLIGAAGVSAVPMAARVVQVEGQKANPNNFLLMQAMGPNVAGVIGSAVAAGVLLQLFGS